MNRYRAFGLLAVVMMVISSPADQIICHYKLDCQSCGNKTIYGICMPDEGCYTYACHDGACGTPAACYYLCGQPYTFKSQAMYCN